MNRKRVIISIVSTIAVITLTFNYWLIFEPDNTIRVAENGNIITTLNNTFATVNIKAFSVDLDFGYHA